MKITASGTSKYLKKEEVPQPRLLTVKAIKMENLGTESDPEKKWVMYFEGEEKGLVLNKNNIQRATTAFKSDDSDDWVGRQIVLYVDHNVEFGGKMVGGLRIRPTKQDMAKEEPDVPF